MESSIYLYLSLLLAPISSVITWFAARRKRNLETTDLMQQTINALQARQNEMVQEIMKLQRDNIELQKEQARLMSILTAEQLMQYKDLWHNDK